MRHAVHEDTREEYAVKVFDRASLPDGDFDRDVKKEVRIMQHLRHPNIVSIHAVLVTTSKMYLVMELVRGGELYDEIVLRRRIDEDTSRKYFQQLIDAMVYCHRRGVVHRDLKPENLLLDGNGNLKVTDFGMSWMKDNMDPEVKTKQLLRTQCGTPKYMAPEIIVRPSKGYDGEKLDAWECGMVLYALLAGYLPFAGDDDDAVFRSILKGTVKFPSFFSAGAKSLLVRLLEKDPEKRASLEEVRQHPWFQINYFGDAATVSPPEEQPSDSKPDAQIGDADSLLKLSKGMKDSCNRDMKSGQAMGTSLPPSPAEATRAKRSAAAARRKQVMNLNLLDIHADPFDVELREVEVPATPVPTKNSSVGLAHAIVTSGDQKVSRTRNATPTKGDRQEPSLRPLTSPPKGKVRDPRMGNVFVSKLPSFGAPRSSRPDEQLDNDGPLSLRDRISGSAFGAVIRSLRDGLSPTKNDKTLHAGMVHESAKYADDSPTSITQAGSVSPLSSGNEGSRDGVKEGKGGLVSQSPKKKLVKAFQRKTTN